MVYERAVALLEAPLGDEIVALEPEGGHCFGFNSVAAAVWRQLSAPQSFAQLKDALLDEFEVSDAQCAAELSELLLRLQEDGLVRQRKGVDLPSKS